MNLPLGTSAPVVGASGTALQLGNFGSVGVAPSNYQMYYNSDALGATSTTNSYGINVTSDPTKSTLFADLTKATAATINSLRQAFQLQRMQERDARGGTRYAQF